MVKKTIKYTDFNEVEREENFYFNLSIQELIAMERDDPSGSLAKRLEGLVKTENVFDILEFVEWIVRKAYGVRTEDGRGFRKSEEETEAFIQSAAYDEFYLSFLEDPEGAAEFINSLMPKKLPKGMTLEALPS